MYTERRRTTADVMYVWTHNEYYAPGSSLNWGRTCPKEVMVSKGTRYMVAVVNFLSPVGADSCTYCTRPCESKTTSCRIIGGSCEIGMKGLIVWRGAYLEAAVVGGADREDHAVGRLLLRQPT